MRRYGLPSEPAQIVRGVRLHVGIQQQALAKVHGRGKAWLAKRETGLARMTVREAKDLMLAILTMNGVGTVKKNEPKMADLQKSDTAQQG